MDQASAAKGQEAAAGGVGLAPVGGAEGCVDLGPEGQGGAGPGLEGVALGEDPVDAAVEVDDDEAGVGGLRGEEGGVWGCACEALVEEGDGEGDAAEGFEEGEGR